MRRRRLSYRQAFACEQGTPRRCRCRCGGTLHGAKRLGEAPSDNDFAGLPRDDPHRTRDQLSMPPRELPPLVPHAKPSTTRDHGNAPTDDVGCASVDHAAAASES